MGVREPTWVIVRGVTLEGRWRARAYWLFGALLAASSVGWPAQALGAAPPQRGRLWYAVTEDALGPAATAFIAPGEHRVLGLDQAELVDLLAQAPLEDADEVARAPVVMELPWPDGSFKTFRIEESPIMEPELAARFPDIRTYRGQGLDDPSAIARFDWTLRGFHALVLSSEGTVYIDPRSPGDTQNYLVSYRRDHRGGGNPPRCLVTGEEPEMRADTQPAIGLQQVPHGTLRRTYRLALAATGEYTAFFGGTVSGAMSGIATTMNRVNGLFERDLAVRMVLVANNDSIVYTSGATDPYTDGNPSALLCENAVNLDTVIGVANYDIGHVFATASGGLALVGGACLNTSGGTCGTGSRKAWGTTGVDIPQGDAFDVDYVAHEMGHQFGGSHTFNGTTDGCGGGNRTAASAYEPGSGSTIMAYAGVCGVENLQLHSDTYFHARSQEQIIAFVNGTLCPTVNTTANTPPVVDAGPDYTIPSRTPFVLTATGGDPDGDALTYAWEQFDLGPASPPDSDNGLRPIFRSFTPVASPSRTFPKLADLLNDTVTLGESLPTTTRALTFRVTARDNRVGGGGTSSDSMVLNVRADSGPFAVTQPNTPVSWASGSSQTVNWNVANTFAAPVSCATVRILLSLDGGQSFPIVLDAGTPNDGSQMVTLPPSGTSLARIKVEAVGNVFFDVSNANFMITVTDLIFRDDFES
jgi:hypothetical protein